MLQLDEDPNKNAGVVGNEPVAQIRDAGERSFVRERPSRRANLCFRCAGPVAPEGGGLVEIDDQGHVIRAASSADPAFPDALLMPYGLLPVPEIDRVVVTNSSPEARTAYEMGA
jgi:hypothetical protein